MHLFIYSLGPGVLLRVLTPGGFFSLTAFLAAAALLQVEPLIRELAGSGGLIWSQTLIGPLAAAGLIAWPGRDFIGSCRRLGWKTLRPHFRGRPDLGPPSREALFNGALAGGLVCLLFAALTGTAEAPFWPVRPDNPLAQALSPGRVQRLSALFWPLSLVLWGFRHGSGR